MLPIRNIFMSPICVSSKITPPYCREDCGAQNESCKIDCHSKSFPWALQHTLLQYFYDIKRLVFPTSSIPLLMPESGHWSLVSSASILHMHGRTVLLVVYRSHYDAATRNKRRMPTSEYFIPNMLASV